MSKKQPKIKGWSDKRQFFHKVSFVEVNTILQLQKIIKLLTKLFENLLRENTELNNAQPGCFYLIQVWKRKSNFFSVPDPLPGNVLWILLFETLYHTRNHAGLTKGKHVYFGSWFKTRFFNSSVFPYFPNNQYDPTMNCKLAPRE